MAFILTGCLNPKATDLSFRKIDQHEHTDSHTYPTFISPTKIETRLGDRIFVSNVLSKIFGPQANEDILTLVTRQQGAFGGVCDASDNTDSCFAPKNNVIISPSSTIRSGALIKACKEITAKTENIEHALGLNQLHVNSPINKTTLIKQFQLFAPFKQIPPKALDQLIAQANDTENTIIDWKTIHLLFCVNPAWTIP